MQLIPIAGIPLVQPGDCVASIIADALAKQQLLLEPDDLLVIAQKIISKAERRQVSLSQVSPSARALALADEVQKDPRLVELILQESVEVLRKRPGLLVVEHRLGYIHANAGIDQSNIEGDDTALLLPVDPDGSALGVRERLKLLTGIAPYVLINDSAGRAWRNGVAGFALGCAGFEPLSSRIGEPDLFGRTLEATEVAVADELAAAASHLMGQGSEGIPAVLIRGARLTPSNTGMRPLIREKARDMFR